MISAVGSGIGLAIARGLVDDGWQVVGCDADPAALAALGASDPGIHAYLADVADPASVENFFAQANLESLDLLVNNAGIAGPTARLEDQPVDGWQRTIDINLNGMFHMARLAIPLLRARAKGAAIINMSSSAGLFGFALRTPYVASKWAVIGLTKALAIELGPLGITVNAICPGSVEGERIDRVIAADAAARGIDARQVEQEYKRQTSLRSFVRTGDVVAMVRYLCSDGGSRISGQALAIDGHTESVSLQMED